MPSTLRKGDRGPEVRELQKLLQEQGLDLIVDGDFGKKTQDAVRAFQAQHLDPNGHPLLADGVAGALTWWALSHPRPAAAAVAALDFSRMPDADLGGSRVGRAALEAAIGELRAGAGEIGGNNRGRWVEKYHDGRADPGDAWCAAFASWCFREANRRLTGNPHADAPFGYTVGARDVLARCRRKGWAHGPAERYSPEPGDLVAWWRVRADGWQGHVGIVHQVRDGYLYTIEGNHSSMVAGFSYVLTRMEKLLGFARIPDGADM